MDDWEKHYLTLTLGIGIPLVLIIALWFSGRIDRWTGATDNPTGTLPVLGF